MLSIEIFPSFLAFPSDLSVDGLGRSALFRYGNNVASPFVRSSGGPMGVGGASRLFRDFVEKLERAYIAFDGVVGSCLGCAWGGPPTTTWTTTLTLFRETQNPISQNAPHSLSFFSSPSLLVGLLSCFYPSSFANSSLFASLRVPFSCFFSTWLLGLSKKAEFNSSCIHSFMS